MGLPKKLYGYLSSHSGLYALVGDAIYPNVFPQDIPPPYVALQRVGQDKIYTHGGYSGTSITMYRLTSLAATKEKVEQIAQQIALAMADWSELDPAIGFAIEKNCGDAYEVSPDLFRVDQDYKIFYNE